MTKSTSRDYEYSENSGFLSCHERNPSQISSIMNQQLIEDVTGTIRSKLVEAFPIEHETSSVPIAEIKYLLIKCLDESIAKFPTHVVNTTESEISDDITELDSISISTSGMDILPYENMTDVDHNIFLGFTGISNGDLQKTRNDYWKYTSTSRSKLMWLSAIVTVSSLLFAIPAYSIGERNLNGYNIFAYLCASSLAIAFIFMLMIRFKFTKNIFYQYHGLNSTITNNVLKDFLIVTSQLFTSMFMLGDVSNQVITINQLPMNVLIAIFLMPCLQIFVNIVSRRAIFICQTISVVSTNIYLSQVRSHSEVYVSINALLIILVCASYELERSSIGEYVRYIKTWHISRFHALLQYKTANEKIEESIRLFDSKCKIVKHVGHEVRTPLNIIGVGVETLENELLKYANILPLFVFDTINSLKGASTSAVDSINELMLFEKLTAGMNCISPTIVNLVDFLKGCMSYHKISAEAKQLRYELTGGDLYLDLLINVDPLKMGTVFRNILSNAIKFTPKFGNVIVNLTKLLEFGDREYVLISVKDTGAGVSNENLSKMFGEGVQFNANELQGGGGSGLGLFISKEIVKQHDDCCIWVESEGCGNGCTFYVKIPVLDTIQAREYADPRNRISSISSAGSHDTISLSGHYDSLFMKKVNKRPSTVSITAVVSNKPINILIVDDSMANRKIMSRLLVSNGYLTFDACDGAQAVALVSNSMSSKRPSITGDEIVSVANFVTYDVILMDSIMPNMNGPNATIALRKLGYKGPIIGVSGLDDDTEFMSAGADMMLIKPVSSKLLKQSIESSLEARMNMMKCKDSRRDSLKSD